MTLEEMLRGSPLNRQRMADDNAISLAGMLARQGAGTVRQEPSLMQEIGGAITDYAVPDRYLPSSVMEPRLDMSQLESLRGTPVDMADVPDPVPMLMDTMPMAGITAFHGSPHKFDKFDMSKIGTGEGAQAYGHGLYFAENPNVAKGYDEAGSHMAWDIDGQRYHGQTTRMDAGEGNFAANALDRFDGDVDKAIDWLDDYGMEAEAKGFLRRMKRKKASIDKAEGNLYKVDIPDDQIAKMLDWDKPLSEQPKIFRDWVDKQNDMIKNTSNPDFGMHQLLRSRNASEELRPLGFKGIKYLDQGSRGTGKGTSNFVLFDDQLPTIESINDQPIGLIHGR